MKTLEQYFRDCAEKGIVDFSLRASLKEYHVEFYIHPGGVDGETMDFELSGNGLKERGAV